MKYIYTNHTTVKQSVLLANLDQSIVHLRTFMPGASLELSYPGLNLYVPNILTCIVIGDEDSAHVEPAVKQEQEKSEPVKVVEAPVSEPAPVEPTIQLEEPAPVEEPAAPVSEPAPAVEAETTENTPDNVAAVEASTTTEEVKAAAPVKKATKSTASKTTKKAKK